MKSLIIGMGIGQLYARVLESLGHDVVTVDLDATKAQFTDLDEALKEGPFATAHICTPNYTHLELAKKISPHVGILMVEKPGVRTSVEWSELFAHCLNTRTRLMMVKNNQYRDSIEEIANLAKTSSKVILRWENANRIPFPGSWFTTKSKAFSGVSRDLMPHLLSIFSLCDVTDEFAEIKTERRYSLETITSTDYGTIDKNGVYDVDDRAECIITGRSGTQWELIADWANGIKDDRSITFVSRTGIETRYELGLCPELAYQEMITAALNHVESDEWWMRQYVQDVWIHTELERLSNEY